jgi:hypothetical protein
LEFLRSGLTIDLLTSRDKRSQPFEKNRDQQKSQTAGEERSWRDMSVLA